MGNIVSGKVIEMSRHTSDGWSQWREIGPLGINVQGCDLIKLRERPPFQPGYFRPNRTSSENHNTIYWAEYEGDLYSEVLEGPFNCHRVKVEISYE